MVDIGKHESRQFRRRDRQSATERVLLNLPPRIAALMRGYIRLCPHGMERRVCGMHFARGMSAEEIADKLGITPRRARELIQSITVRIRMDRQRQTREAELSKLATKD